MNRSGEGENGRDRLSERMQLACPSASPLFNRRTAALIFVYQNRRLATIYCFRQNYSAAATTVFFISVRDGYQYIFVCHIKLFAMQNKRLCIGRKRVRYGPLSETLYHHLLYNGKPCSAASTS